MSNNGALEISHRRELTGYCTRILGSACDADDAVQETMVRAWTRRDSFEGRSSVRSWTYRIATNVCLDMLRSRRRRAVPVDVEGPDPFPEGRHPAADHDPAELAALREAVEEAFAVVLTCLPARQRAVLVLREVLRWSAPEVAELLGTTVASVNSALQRARATLSAGTGTGTGAVVPRRLDAGERARVVPYVTALAHHDIAGLITLLYEEAVMSSDAKK